MATDTPEARAVLTPAAMRFQRWKRPARPRPRPLSCSGKDAHHPVPQRAAQRSTRTCQDVRQDVHMRCPQGSIFTSLSFSAQILHSWKVEPISQYNSYCSWDLRNIHRSLLSLFQILAEQANQATTRAKTRSIKAVTLCTHSADIKAVQRGQHSPTQQKSPVLVLR